MSGRLARGWMRHPERLGAFIRKRRALGLHVSDLVCALQIDRRARRDRRQFRPERDRRSPHQAGVLSGGAARRHLPWLRPQRLCRRPRLGWISPRGAGDRHCHRRQPAMGKSPCREHCRCGRSRFTTSASISPASRERDRTGRAGRFSVLFVGRMVEKKGLRVLLAAIAALRARGRDLEVQAIGDGPEENALRAEASAAGLDGSVTFHGSQPHDCRASDDEPVRLPCAPERHRRERRPGRHPGDADGGHGGRPAGGLDLSLRHPRTGDGRRDGPPRAGARCGRARRRARPADDRERASPTGSPQARAGSSRPSSTPGSRTGDCST